MVLIQRHSMEAISIEQTEKARRHSLVDPRLTAALDNIALLTSCAFLLVGLTLVTANVVAVVSPLPTCDYTRKFVQLYLPLSIGFLLSTLFSLFVLIYAMPGSTLAKYKNRILSLMTLFPILTFLGGCYGTFLFLSPPIEAIQCIDTIQYHVLILDIIVTHLFIGLPIGLLSYLLISGRLNNNNKKGSRFVQSKTHVDRFVL